MLGEREGRGGVGEVLEGDVTAAQAHLLRVRVRVRVRVEGEGEGEG